MKQRLKLFFFLSTSMHTVIFNRQYITHIEASIKSCNLSGQKTLWAMPFSESMFRFMIFASYISYCMRKALQNVIDQSFSNF